MVDSVKCCGQVEQGEDRQVTVVDCVQNVSQYFQHCRLRGVVSPICGLQAWQQVCRAAVELSGNDALKKLGDDR